MLKPDEIAEKAFGLIDKNIYEAIFYSPVGLSSVEVRGGFTIILLIIAVIVLFIYLDRNNGFTPGHHSRQDGAFWLAAIVIFVPFYFLKPDAESIHKTEASLYTRMIKAVPLVIEGEIKRDVDLTSKLKIITDNVDSSGRLYYISNVTTENDPNSKRYGSKIHHYINSHNYQKEYVDGVKQLETRYNKDVKTAEFLQDVFKNGNIFVEKNKTKAVKYKTDILELKKAAEQRELETIKAAEQRQKELDKKIPEVVPAKT